MKRIMYIFIFVLSLFYENKVIADTLIGYLGDDILQDKIISIDTETGFASTKSIIDLYGASDFAVDFLNQNAYIFGCKVISRDTLYDDTGGVIDIIIEYENRLYTVDLKTGESKYINFNPQGEGQFGFDILCKDTLIGYRYNGSQIEIISINTKTGFTSVISIIDLDGAGIFAVDFLNQNAYVYGKKVSEYEGRLYTVDLKTGESEYINFNPQGEGQFGFDILYKDTLIGYRCNGSQIEIISIDTKSGLISIRTILDIEFVSGFAVDFLNQNAYIYGGKEISRDTIYDDTGNVIEINIEYKHELYTVNLQTNIDSSITFNLPIGYQFYFDVYPLAIKLFTIIPGINDEGKMMIKRAENMFPYLRFDNNCLLSIKEEENHSEGYIREKIKNTLKNVNEYRKDMVINIDMNLNMDLEDFLWSYWLPSNQNPWLSSIDWAGRIINIVSEEFKKQYPNGYRIIYAHSAGVDAVYRSLNKKTGENMYDNINLLNGRTNSSFLKNALKRNNYKWWQVKVFTSKGDYPAIPFISLSNYDASWRFSRDSWVHMHCLENKGHSGLRDDIGISSKFEINIGGKNWMIDYYTVEKAIEKDWREEIE